MQQMDCINQQARERDCKLTKRSQAERLAIADSLIASVWEEYLNGSIDRGTLQMAAYIQANANRIVWKLNALNNPNTPNTLEALDCISRKDAIDLAEEVETKRLKGEIDLTYAPMVKGLTQLPSAKPNLQPTCNQLATDCISRQKAIEAINTWDKFGVDERGRLVRWHEGLEPYVHLRDVLTAIVNLPSILP